MGPFRLVRAGLKWSLLAVAVALPGLPLGLLWSLLSPAVPLRVGDSGPAYADPQPQQVAAADAWFALLGLGFGVLVAAACWRLAPRLRGPAGLVALVAGLVGAGLLAWWLGRQVGLAGHEAALASAPPGTVLDRPPDLRVAGARWWPPVVSGVPLVPALSATATYTLLAAWSRFPSLRPTRGVLAAGPCLPGHGSAPRLDRC